MKTNSYENKVALVTGGTSGIGKATALAFANAGAKVVLTGRREKEATEVVAEIKKRGGTASFFKADFAEDFDLRAAVDFVLTTYGRLDIAFNNAGVEASAPLDQVTEEQYRKVFDINVWGVLNSMKHVGARDELQLRENLGAIGWNLTPTQVAKLDSVSARLPPSPYWHP